MRHGWRWNNSDHFYQGAGGASIAEGEAAVGVGLIGSRIVAAARVAAALHLARATGESGRASRDDRDGPGESGGRCPAEWAIERLGG